MLIISLLCILTLLFSVFSVIAQENAEDFSDPYYDNTDPVGVGGSDASSAAGAGIVVLGFFFVIIWIIFVVAIFALALFMLLVWIFMLIDVVKRADWKDDNEKIMWLLIVILLGGIGAIIYYFAVRHPRGPA